MKILSRNATYGKPIESTSQQTLGERITNARKRVSAVVKLVLWAAATASTAFCLDYSRERCMELVDEISCGSSGKKLADKFDGYIQDHKISRAANIFHLMVKTKTPPNRATCQKMFDDGCTAEMCTDLISACNKNHNIASAIKALDLMITIGHNPKKHIYTELIDTCIKKKDVVNASHVLDQVTKKTATDRAIQKAALDRLMKVNKTMRKKKVSEAKYQKSKELYKKMYGKLKAEYQQDKELHKKMYEKFIAICIKKKDIVHAFHFFDVMIQSNIQPELSIYHKLFTLCIQNHDASYTFYLFNQARERPELKELTFNILINNYLEHSDISSALNAVKMMHEEGIEPSTFIKSRLQLAKKRLDILN